MSKEKKGMRLKEFRERHTGMTQDVFAKEIGYTQVHLSAMEAGKKNVSADVSEAVANRFSELNLDWLFRGRGSMIYQMKPTKRDLPNEDNTYPSIVNEDAVKYGNALIKVAEFDNYVVFKRV
jgi:transcriptional regulator with XRE-family HTH domain